MKSRLSYYWRRLKMSVRQRGHAIASSPTRRLWGYRLSGWSRQIETEPIIILGNQKSGTSAIAALLGERTGVPYSIDLRDEIRQHIFDRVISGELSLRRLVRKNRLDFTRKIVKEPNLSFLYPQLKKRFSKAQFVMVIRDPRDNLRSILDRHKLPGDLPALSLEQISSLGPAWEAIIYNHGLEISAENHIQHMAERWRIIANIYLENADDITLVRYEEFKEDKLTVIDALASKLRLRIRNNIDDKLDNPFQKPGKPVSDYHKYFGINNYSYIIETCKKEMAALDYAP